jgi:hypothetical protein
MSDEPTVKEFYERIQKDRFKFFGAYKIDKWVTTCCMLLCFGFLFYVAYSADFKLDYYSCVEPAPGMYQGCKNPFYQPTTWVNIEYLPPGEYGTKPGFLFNNAWIITIIIFILGGIANHFIHNKGFKFVPTEKELIEKGVLPNERDNDNEP